MKTIKDIADLSGYSIGTVSRVLNDRPDVSETARNKILEIIEKEGYRPNANARHLKQTTSSDITVFVKKSNSIFLNSVLERIQKQLREHDEEAQAIFLDESDNEVEHAIKICHDRKPKGIIFLGADLTYWKEDFKRITVPSVLVTGSAAELSFENLSSFCTDDYGGGKAAMERLLDKGHQKVAVIGGSLPHEVRQVPLKRLSGAKDAMLVRNMDPEKNLIYLPCKFSIEEGYDKAKEFLLKQEGVTGIFALNDMIAIGCLRAIYDCGYSVPEDISLIGFDGIEHTKYTVPRISTVAQDVDQIAEKSVEDLLFRISYPKGPIHRLIPFRIIDNESIRDI